VSPQGVEHPDQPPAKRPAHRVKPSVSPQGVEHRPGTVMSAEEIVVVKPSVSPQGVEHYKTSDNVNH